MFNCKSRFTRYIHPDQKLNSKRASSNAFVEDEMGSHLSVHLIGLASRAEIANHYRDIFQGGKGKAAFFVHTVYQYNEASSNTKGKVLFNRESRQWEFDEKNKKSVAYKHRPKSYWAHCGIEYVRVLDTNEMQKVATRLARKSYETA